MKNWSIRFIPFLNWPPLTSSLPCPTSPLQRCSASPAEISRPPAGISAAADRWPGWPPASQAPGNSSPSGALLAPVRIPAAKVSRIRTIQKVLAFQGRSLAAPVPLQVPAGRDGPQGLFFLEFLQWDGKREPIPFFPSSEVSCLKAGPIVDTYYQVCLLKYYQLWHDLDKSTAYQGVTEAPSGKSQTDYTRFTDKLHEVRLRKSDKLHDFFRKVRTNYTRFSGRLQMAP